MQTKFDINEWVYVPCVDMCGIFNEIKKVQVIGIEINQTSVQYRLSDFPESPQNEKNIFNTREKARIAARQMCEEHISKIKETMNHI